MILVSGREWHLDVLLKQILLRE